MTSYRGCAASLPFHSVWQGYHAHAYCTGLSNDPVQPVDGEDAQENPESVDEL